MSMSREPRLPARERWFWAGVGFVGALAVMLLGLFFATTLTARDASKRVVVRQEPPAPPAAVPAPPAQATAPARAEQAAPRDAEKPTAAPPPRQRPSHAVRVVERPRPPEREAASAPKDPRPAAPKAQRPPEGAPSRAAEARKTPNPRREGEAGQVAGSREEWGDRSPAPRPKPPAAESRQQPAAPRRPERRAPAPPEPRAATPPQLIASRDAEYPPTAAADGVTGSVQLRLRVDPEGFVEQADVVESSGDGRLDAAAARAALTWRYRPARLGGRAVAGVDHVTFEFYRRDE